MAGIAGQSINAIDKTYTHRIIEVNDRKVTFKWRDYKDKSKEKIMVLPAEEFMPRFLLHVLPTQFTKIWHYGFLASAVKMKKLTLCKKLLRVHISAKTNKKPDTLELIKQLTGINVTRCPIFGATLTRASPELITAYARIRTPIHLKRGSYV